MVYETKIWLILSLLFGASYMQHFVYGKPQVPCIFIFGDSLSDSGNNNNLLTASKVNFKPYGIDFPKGTTGRFTNGLTAIDIIGQILGFEDFIPPFANIGGSDILKGVNYASGSAGIRYETGKHLGVNVELGLQLQHHKIIVDQIGTKLGGDQKASQYLNKCLYYVNIGSNDFISNYFLPQFYPTRRIYKPEQYVEDLVNKLSQSLKILHDVGARKFVVFGVGPIGCTPNAIANHGSCIEEQNAAAFIFGTKLKSLVDQLNSQFTDSKFLFRNISSDPFDTSHGFKVVDAACCELTLNATCTRDKTPCHNRNEYKFWDGFHPTSAANKLVAFNSYYSSNPNIVYPINIQHLLHSS